LVGIRLFGIRCSLGFVVLFGILCSLGIHRALVIRLL
jgi:hypothetical protein